MARTEGRVIAAATRLFLERGYTATTLADVAEAADVGDRTVYVRFGSKALFFKRVVDVAIVGDTQPGNVLGRDWMQLAFTAPTLDERLRATASANRQILERTGALFAVAQQAAAVEPLIAGFWQEGRRGLRHGQRAVWTRVADDGLLPAGCDLEWEDRFKTAASRLTRRPTCSPPACWPGTSTPTRRGWSTPSAAWSPRRRPRSRPEHRPAKRPPAAASCPTLVAFDDEGRGRRQRFGSVAS